MLTLMEKGYIGSILFKLMSEKYDGEYGLDSG
jgi:hypothetical protein